MNKVKRAVTVIILAFILLVVMSGCIRVEFGVELNEDGTGRISNTTAISKEFYDYMVESGSDPFADKETKTKEINGKTYVYVTEDSGKLSYKEIEDMLTNYESDIESESEIPLYKDVSITKKRGLFKTEYRFKMVTNKDAVQGQEGMPASEIVEIYTYVKMPGKVTSHKPKDGRVEILINNFDQENTYEVVSEKTNTMLIVILLIAVFVFFLIVIGVVVIIIVVSKKKRKVQSNPQV